MSEEVSMEDLEGEWKVNPEYRSKLDKELPAAWQIAKSLNRPMYVDYQPGNGTRYEIIMVSGGSVSNFNAVYHGWDILVLIGDSSSLRGSMKVRPGTCTAPGYIMEKLKMTLRGDAEAISDFIWGLVHAS